MRSLATIVRDNLIRVSNAVGVIPSNTLASELKRELSTELGIIHDKLLERLLSETEEVRKLGPVSPRPDLTEVFSSALAKEEVEIDLSVDSLSRAEASAMNVSPTKSRSHGDDSRSEQVPKVFISYSWDSRSHKDWVIALGTKLRKDGVEVILDVWHLALGDPLPKFMERSVANSDFVLVIATPNYKDKADQGVGGVGYEKSIMTAEVYNSQKHRKFIPVLRSGEWDKGLPKWMESKRGTDLRNDPYSYDEYHTLLDTIRGDLPLAPPIGFNTTQYKILNTLWINQVNKYGRPGTAFTFRITEVATDYIEARRHGTDLIAKGLVGEDKGFYKLTPMGFDFCKKHFREFPPDHWFEAELDENRLAELLATPGMTDGE